MLSKIPPEYLRLLTVRDLETLLEAKRRDEELRELLEQRDKLRRELEKVEERIRQIEERRIASLGKRNQQPIVVRKRKTLKEYIVEVLKEAKEPLTAGEIKQRLVDKGFLGGGTNPRSFYNTVFQALQRYDIFEKQGKRYRLKPEKGEIKVEGTATLKDYIAAVLKHAQTPLKASEIASRVLIAGYKTDLGPDALTQRVTTTLKKHLGELFDWDSQRYKLIEKH